MNQGAWYYDHFTAFFGNPVGRTIFRTEKIAQSIQILAYDEVFAGCRVFCSLGATHHAAALGGISEIILPIDTGWQEVPHIFATTLFAMIQDHISLEKGIAVRGIQTFHPRFVARYGKTALYFTNPYNLPSDFNLVSCGGIMGKMYLALFITDSEYTFFVDHGTEKFEAMMEARGVDPFELQRSPFV